MYNNNISLRSAGEKVEYTQELVNEWVKCKEDILYFAENYYQIVSIDHGKILIPLREYQKRMLKSLVGVEGEDKRHRIVLSGRQSGKTEISVLYLLHFALFQKEKNIAILANNERTATDILSKLKTSYESLPIWLQQGILDGGWSKTSVRLENGCKYFQDQHLRTVFVVELLTYYFWMSLLLFLITLQMILLLQYIQQFHLVRLLKL